MNRLKFYLFMAMCVMPLGYAAAQSYPSKPVRVVIPWPPGGGNDIAGRIVMQKMSEAMGQQFAVDNRGGAGGTIGTEYLAKQPADGYTLMVQSTTHVGNAHLYKRLAYDPLKDFTGVGLITSQALVLTVHPSMPTRTVKEFIALARARPGEILYSTAGNGSAPHLSMALLASMTGTKLVHVPYKGGGPQVIALVAGESQSSLAVIASVVQHVRGGRLRALGVSSLRRSASLPEIPPIAESGVTGYEMNPWIGVFAPAGLPRPILDRLNAEINKVLKLPEVERNLANQGLDAWSSTPDEFASRLKSDYEKYAQLVKLTGATID
jgi:tripartite-type tricarboxylate transporter receptor subunit TctC